MVLNRYNQRRYYKNLYRGTGTLIQVTFTKRGDDQSMGTTANYVLSNCRMKKSHRRGEVVQSDMTADDVTVWQIPLQSLIDVGLDPITDRPVFGDMILNNVETASEGYGQTWMVEATDEITQQLIGDCYNLFCRRHT